MSFDLIMNLWIGGCVGYNYYVMFKMKKSGHVSTGWLISKNLIMSRKKDEKAYIEYMDKRTLIFTIIVELCVVINLISLMALKVFFAQLISFLVMGVTAVWYCIHCQRAVKKFLSV